MKRIVEPFVRIFYGLVMKTYYFHEIGLHEIESVHTISGFYEHCKKGFDTGWDATLETAILVIGLVTLYSGIRDLIKHYKQNKKEA